MSIEYSIQSAVIFILLFIGLVVNIIPPRDKFGWLRFLIYIAAFAVLLEPSVVVKEAQREQSSVGIFLDMSRSMEPGDKFKKVMSDAREIKEDLEDLCEIRLFKFSDKVWETDFNSLSSKTDFTWGDSTNIEKVILKNGLDARFILTDGRYNEGRSPLVLNELSNSPVYPVGVDIDREVPNLEITDFKNPGFGYRGEDTQIEFTLLNRSRSPERTTAYIEGPRGIVARKEIDLDQKEEIPVTMHISSEEIGLREYKLTVESLAGELNKINNTRNFPVNIKRKKIRVLYVAGTPSTEYAFFRRLIKSDPHIDLTTFLILRNPDNVTIVPEHELSLIQFPAREMFTQKIYDFDLLIYDNFRYSRFFPRSYLEHIKEFVLKGGGFIMTGGDSSFGRGDYINTPIQDLLPVEMSRDSDWVNQKFQPDLTGSISHPLLNLAGDETISGEVWRDMPLLEGYDDSLRAKEEATVLLNNDRGIPILSLAERGDGRVMALNTNTTWRWCMGLSGQGKTPFYYNQFWHNVIRFMIKSGDQENVRIFPGRKTVNTGEEINLNINAVDQYWEPLENARIRLDITSPSGDRIPAGRIEASSEPGWYRAQVFVEETGIYHLEARAYHSGRLVGKGEETFRGEYLDKEMLNLSLDSDLLMNMAQKSGGQYFIAGNLNLSEIRESIGNLIDESREIVMRYNWHELPIYILLMVILLSEWLLRRKAGLS